VSSREPHLTELEVEAEVQEFIAAIEDDSPVVGIVTGSEDDRHAMRLAEVELRDRRIRFEVRLLRVGEHPDDVAAYARTAQLRGLKVIIAGAAEAPMLAGVVALHTRLPVIGVPLGAAELGGVAAVLATAQASAGAPVACVALGGARNAAILAARILAV
jgi:phosphoribosylaminoimidazole carboxylase PurE protein